MTAIDELDRDTSECSTHGRECELHGMWDIKDYPDGCPACIESDRIQDFDDYKGWAES